MNRHLANAETQLFKARNAYKQSAKNPVNGAMMYQATVYHFLGEAQLRIYGGFTDREAHAIARRYETRNQRLTDVIADYAATHTV